MKKLSSRSRFIDLKIKEAFYALENGDGQERHLFKALNKGIDAIEENAFCGIQITKKLIPKYYIRNYNVVNLWKYNLPGGWRLLYSITDEEILVVTIVLEWLDHQQYERRFNY